MIEKTELVVMAASAANLSPEEEPGGSPVAVPPASLQDDAPPVEWQEATAADGRTYYYHPVTHETSWKKPVPSLQSFNAEL